MLTRHGEILVRGENVATAYRQHDQTQPVMESDGWFHTGDMGETGADGRLYFKGRRKNVIVTPAGMNVYPEDLEKAVRHEPGVRDCVVIGIERDGNAEPCAVLLLEDPQRANPIVIDRKRQSFARGISKDPPLVCVARSRFPAHAHSEAAAAAHSRGRQCKSGCSACHAAERRQFPGRADRPNHRAPGRRRFTRRRARRRPAHDFARSRRADERA